MNTRLLTTGILALVLAIATCGISVPNVQGTEVGFPSLVTHNWNDVASSLSVTGTVKLYEAVDYGGNMITFTNTGVYDLGYYGWNDIVSSLKVDGTVTLYENTYYGGNKITFTSSSIPYDYLGTEWNLNPTLVKSQGRWDARVWYWTTNTHHNPAPDSNNYMTWVSDGLVMGRSEDHWDSYWKAEDFAQGYERDMDGIPNLPDYPINWYTWNDITSSLKVEGTVTLYEAINYGGRSITFTNTWVPSLVPYGWNDIASSLKLWGKVTLYEAINYGGASVTFDCKPSYQPPLLNVGSQYSIKLEGIVDNWDSPWVTMPSWSGAKFDVWAVENKGTGKKLMLELYFIRGGANLAWPVQGGNERELYRKTDPNSDVWNYLAAIDAFPQDVSRVIHPGDVAKWTINVKAFIQRACDHWPSDFNINNLFIAKICFTLETGYIVPPNPLVYSSLLRLRLAYQSGGGGGGCPILYAYNGGEYKSEGLLDIHYPYGADIVTDHRLTSTPDRVNGAYLFRLVEHPQTVSHIDQVRLQAILENGVVKELPLIWARHSEYGNVLSELRFSDERKTETKGSDHNNGISQSVDLRFAALPNHLKPVAFVFIIEGNNPYYKT